MKFKREGKFYAYIVECQDGTYYTGYTRDLERRINEHNSDCGRGAKYLRGKTPVKLVYAKEYRYYKNAVRAELGIKKHTRMEKEVVIRASRKNTEKLVSPDLLRKSKRGGVTAKRFLLKRLAGRWFRYHRTIMPFLEEIYKDKLAELNTYIPKG